MSLIEYTLEGRRDKVQIAIDRIKNFDPIATGLMDTPYQLAYSGGKDSDCIRILFELAGVRHDLIHNHTTVDAPKTVYYIRSIPGIQISYPDMSMWELIVKQRMPPTRLMRFCCQVLKESSGHDRFVATGVRWSESVNRKKRRGSVEIVRPRHHIVLNADNDADRRQLETCVTQGKRILNPIIDWKTTDVWEFLRHYGCRSNPLYEQGYTRVGCIGCPMAGAKRQLEEFEKYPKYKAAYIRAFERMVISRREDGLPTSWQTGEEVFDWWTTIKSLEGNRISEQIQLW